MTEKQGTTNKENHSSLYAFTSIIFAVIGVIFILSPYDFASVFIAYLIVLLIIKMSTPTKA